jgi:acyl-CoA thioester hydrolase
VNQPHQFPTIEQIRQLPVQLEKTIPSEWEDRNGHVNVQFYLTLYEEGGYEVLGDAEFIESYFREHEIGMFDFEHHLFYRAEIHVGDRVSTFNRVLDRNNKRFHGAYFIVNESRGKLACMVEYVTGCVSMKTRRTTEFPDDLDQMVINLHDLHKQLDWQSPRCGVLSI